MANFYNIFFYNYTLSMYSLIITQHSFEKFWVRACVRAVSFSTKFHYLPYNFQLQTFIAHLLFKLLIV
jgi:hypothetical protein